MYANRQQVRTSRRGLRQHKMQSLTFLFCPIGFDHPSAYRGLSVKLPIHPLARSRHACPGTLAQSAFSLIRRVLFLCAQQAHASLPMAERSDPSDRNPIPGLPCRVCRECIDGIQFEADVGESTSTRLPPRLDALSLTPAAELFVPTPRGR